LKEKLDENSSCLQTDLQNNGLQPSEVSEHLVNPNSKKIIKKSSFKIHKIRDRSNSVSASSNQTNSNVATPQRVFEAEENLPTSILLDPSKKKIGYRNEAASTI